jgi:hypothetical protein
MPRNLSGKHHRKAVQVARGEGPEDERPGPESDGKDPAAVALGRKGGKARAKSMSAKRRRQIAKNAALSRWQKR